MIEAFPLSWPMGWPRTRLQVEARFNLTFGRARDDLLEEIGRLWTSPQSLAKSAGLAVAKSF